MSTFALPDLGEGLQEAEIVTWHVAEGDHVVAEQPLVAVETEKAVVEIPSPRSGRIAVLRAEEGAVVPVGAPLVDFEDGPHAETGTVVGELEAPPADGTAIPEAGPQKIAADGVVRAAPAVRARARKLGIDLAAIEGSGPNGAITLSDLAFPTGTASGPLLRGVRRSMAANMARAWAEVAHATIHDEADIDAWPGDADVTGRLIRALVFASNAEPTLNARFDPSAPRLEQVPRIDIGIAMDSPEGLFVPVLHDAAGLSPTEVRGRIEALKSGIEQRSLRPDALRGASITLSNFGTLAGRHAALIVMPPQVAILGAGRIADRAIRAPDGIVLHRMLPLSLSFDHRAVTGGEAARFLRAAMTDLETAA